MSGEKSTHVSEAKKKNVSELAELIKNKQTILIASIKNIPSAHYQEIVKKLRGKAIVKVPKKSLIFRALDDSGIETAKKLKEQIGESVAILFSDNDPFDLAADLLSNRNSAKAKAGQEAPEDIGIDAGPTELVPGPAISELGALGIQIKIDKGKIHIKEPKVIVKEGAKITTGQADLMNKLNIKPFMVGFTPVAAFDNKEGKIYLDINIDPGKTLEDLKTAFGKALPFAVEIGYISEDTISFMIGKAGVEGKVLESLAPAEEKPVEEKKEEKKIEETVNDKTDDKPNKPVEIEDEVDKAPETDAQPESGSQPQETQTQGENPEENK